MHSFELEEVQAEHDKGGKLYFEFLRVPDLSMGLYVLPVGASDPQKPHDEDEVYYVVVGRATISVDEVDTAVKTGSIVYVPKGVKHFFHSITEELRVMVFFAPAEYATHAGNNS